MSKEYNPTRISFEIDDKRKDTLMNLIPPGRMSKLFQNYVDYIIAIGEEHPEKISEFVFTTDIDFMEMSEKVKDNARETILHVLNHVRTALSLPPSRVTSLAGVKRSLGEVRDKIESITLSMRGRDGR